ncbi:DUF4038 domain-containing protein [Kribbella lupini]|uniref:DUF4038 domain-containing protein n=1 Tax=Kribbella lupini TaxID=291602 RepID=A0ABN2BTM4_9ACTN
MSISSVWRPVELSATLPSAYGEQVWAEFTHESGERLRRPAFWDGEGARDDGSGDLWRVRFAAPLPGRWEWAFGSSYGVLEVSPAAEDETNPFYAHGFWRMSPGGRSLVHADGTAALLVADTAWALPWRATVSQVREYAADRQAKGFNAVLLMSVQPDMGAVGPRDRTADEGFDVGFEDLPAGHLRQPRAEYFQYLDRLLAALVEHGLVPVLQPVFQGFGWKGLGVAGTVVPAEEYATYCRYLVARYGASPAIYLVGGDGTGLEPQVEAGGSEVHATDCYGQPTGIHYRPHIRASAHQDADWLDFQWCQTGHTGEHVPERVADMWRNLPVRGVANGEPTYEKHGGLDVASGWWQGHEAWSNLCAGGTMGVVYGAGSLWQWRLHGSEPGHSSFFIAPDAGWREAVDFEGSTYVGLVGRVLAGLPVADLEPDWTRVISGRALRGSGGLLIVYREHGGPVMVFDDSVPLSYRIVDPRDGSVVATGRRDTPGDPLPDAGGAPRVYICL